MRRRRCADFESVEINPLTSVSSASAGSDFACATKTNGEVWCWGSNFNNVLGVTFASLSSSPVPMQIQIPAGRQAKAVSAGQTAACALLDDGTVWCWGNNGSGVAGSGSSTVLVPEQIQGIPEVVVSIGVGGVHACALSNTGRVYCWGENNSGQLGRGGATDNAAHDLAAAVIF